MNHRRIIGGVMLAAPFVGIFAFAASELGLLAALGIFAAVIALAAWISAAVEMTS